MSRRSATFAGFFFGLAAALIFSQEETLLTRFSADSSPLSLALGGLGTTLCGRIDGIFTNPSLAASNRTSALQLNFFSDHINGESPNQTDPSTDRSVGGKLGVNGRGLRTLSAVFPWGWQNLTFALCGGWNRLYPYRYRGSGEVTWTDGTGTDLNTETLRYTGRGAQDTLWVGGALAYGDEWGIGVSHTFWTGEGEWKKSFSSDADDTAWTIGRLEQIEGGFWTLGAFFRPVDILFLSASLQTRTRGQMGFGLIDETLEEDGSEAAADQTAELMIPETLTFGLCLGPLYNTSFHSEFYIQFWRQATLTGHSLGAIFPSMEIGEDIQRNEVLFSVGFSHQLRVKGLGEVLLAAGLGWGQPLYTDEQGEPLMLHRYSMGARFRIGRLVAVSAAFRFVKGDWSEIGRFETDRRFPYSFSRSTLLLGVDFYPLGSAD